MSKKSIICAVLVVFALSLNVALAGMDWPQELEEYAAPPYPRANIVHTKSASGILTVIMEVGDQPDKVCEFYKKELTATGWKIVTEVKQQDHSTLVGEKGSDKIVIDSASDQSGKSTVSLTLGPKQQP
jgi:hypothetical protein